jgi:hypothetical protein
MTTRVNNRANEEDPVATAIIRETDAEKADRGMFDQLFTESARRVLPRLDNFQGRNASPGERRTEWQFDSTAAINNERFAAAFDSMATPRNEKWHGLQALNKDLRKRQVIKTWCEEARDVLFTMRYTPKANFASQMSEVYQSLGVFGTGILMIDDALGQPTQYKSCPLAKTWLREGANGQIDTVYRELEYNPAQAIGEFGRDNLPDEILTAEEKKPNQKFTFYHRVQPNKLRVFGVRGPAGMAFSSHYVSVTGRRIVRRGGFRTFPFAVARYVTSSNEVYGRGPAITGLADIKMRNEMKRSVLRSTHRMAEPILLLSDDAALAPFSMQPGFRNRGYLKDDGTPLAQQLEWRGDLQPAMAVIEETGLRLNDIFLVTLFQILAESPTMTATEVLERAREKGVLLTPTVGRFQSEFLGVLIERELDIANARGWLPDMPAELMQAGGMIEITYNSPLARAQKAEQATGLIRTLEVLAPLAQIDPSILKRFKTHGEMIPELAEINGMPLSWLYTQDEFDAIIAEDAKQQQQAQMVAAAQPIATAAKDAAQARVLSQQAGGLF